MFLKKISLLMIVLFSLTGLSLVNSQTSAIGADLRIINGVERPTEKVPVGVLGRSIDGAIECTVNIHTKRIVSTAAHCVYEKEAKDLVIGVGQNIYPDRTIRNPTDIYEIYVHEDYDPVFITNDIAIIVTNEDINIDAYSFLIDIDETDIGFGRICGWGNTSPVGLEVNYPDVLHCADANIIPDSVCQTRIGLYEVDTMVCLDEMKTGSSNGDSGGSLLVELPFSTRNRYTILGITSKGIDGDYGGYTEIYTYIDWINSIADSFGFDRVRVMEFQSLKTDNIDDIDIGGAGTVDNGISDNSVVSEPETPAQTEQPIAETPKDEGIFGFTSIRDVIDSGFELLLALTLVGTFIISLFRGMIIDKLPFGKAYRQAYQNAVTKEANLKDAIHKSKVADRIVAAQQIFEELSGEKGSVNRQTGLESRDNAIDSFTKEMESYGENVPKQKVVEYIQDAYLRCKNQETPRISETNFVAASVVDMENSMARSSDSKRPIKNYFEEFGD